MTFSSLAGRSGSARPTDPLRMLASCGPAWGHLTSAAIGGVAALGAAAAAADPARRAVLGGGDSLPDSSLATSAAFAVLTGAAIPFVATWHSALAVRHRAARAWRGVPDAVQFDRNGTLIHDVPDAVTRENHERGAQPVPAELRRAEETARLATRSIKGSLP